MIIAIASGKGGTGKTTIATNLACMLAHMGKSTQLWDCDVEEPNCHIFLKPSPTLEEAVTILNPRVTEASCTACGICADVCEYNAIAVVKEKVLIFTELCHACGACSYFCPENAIEEIPRAIGTVTRGTAMGLKTVAGLLSIGEYMTPAVIQKVKSTPTASDIVIVDAPPGTSCPVIETIKDVDFVLLVTEPTPFGLNDLILAAGAVGELGIPFAVAINRCDIGNDAVSLYCKKEGIDILLELPNDRKIAEAYSRGEMIISAIPHMEETFEALWNKIESRVITVGHSSSLVER